MRLKGLQILAPIIMWNLVQLYPGTHRHRTGSRIWGQAQNQEAMRNKMDIKWRMFFFSIWLLALVLPQELVAPKPGSGPSCWATQVWPSSFHWFPVRNSKLNAGWFISHRFSHEGSSRFSWLSFDFSWKPLKTIRATYGRRLFHPGWQHAESSKQQNLIFSLLPIWDKTNIHVQNLDYLARSSQPQVLVLDIFQIQSC